MKQKTKYLTEYKQLGYTPGGLTGRLYYKTLLLEVTIIKETEEHIKIEFEDGRNCWITKDDFQRDYKIIEKL